MTDNWTYEVAFSIPGIDEVAGVRSAEVGEGVALPLVFRGDVVAHHGFELLDVDVAPVDAAAWAEDGIDVVDKAVKVVLVDCGGGRRASGGVVEGGCFAGWGGGEMGPGEIHHFDGYWCDVVFKWVALEGGADDGDLEEKEGRVRNEHVLEQSREGEYQARSRSSSETGKPQVFRFLLTARSG